MPPKQANRVAPKSVGGCDDREWFEWGCSWGATLFRGRFPLSVGDEVYPSSPLGTDHRSLTTDH
jgi:hypothetical protein